MPELRIPLSALAAASSAPRYDNSYRGRMLRRISRGCALATCVLAIGAIAGFVLGVRALASPFNPEHATMKPLSAASMLLLSYAVSALATPPKRRRGVWMMRLAGLMALAIALATLVARAFDLDLGLDELFLRDPWPAPGGVPGRPAAATSVGVAMLASAVLLAGRGLAYTGAQALAIGAGSIGVLALIGYALGAKALYAFQSYTQVGPSSALSLALLASGTLAAMPGRGLAGLAASSSVGGVLTRRLVPVAFGVPILLATLAQLATHRGVMRPELGMALFVVGSIASLSAVILHTAHSIHRLDEIRSRSEALLRESSGRVRHLHALIDAADNAIVSFDRAGRVAIWNTRAEQVFGRRAADAIGRHVSEVFAMDAERSLPAALEHVLRRSEPRRVEVRLETPRGDRVEGSLALSPLLDWEKRAVGASAVFEAAAQDRAK